MRSREFRSRDKTDCGHLGLKPQVPFLPTINRLVVANQKNVDSMEIERREREREVLVNKPQ